MTNAFEKSMGIQHCTTSLSVDQLTLSEILQPHSKTTVKATTLNSTLPLNNLTALLD